MYKLPKTYSDKTKDGQKLIFQFTHEKDAYNTNDSGFQDLVMKAFMKVDNAFECVGDLKMTYVPAEDLQERSNDALLFADRYCDFYMKITQEDGERDSDLDTTTHEGKIEAIKVAPAYTQRISEIKDGSYQTLNTQDLNRVYEQVQEMVWSDRRVKQEREELERFSICPGIRFINVEEDHQQKGIATALYKAAALTLGLNGLKLKRGTTRCDKAKFITPDVLESKGLIIEQVQWPGEDRVTEYIDGPAMINELKKKPSSGKLEM